MVLGSLLFIHNPRPKPVLTEILDHTMLVICCFPRDIADYGHLMEMVLGGTVRAVQLGILNLAFVFLGMCLDFLFKGLIGPWKIDWLVHDPGPRRKVRVFLP